MCNQTVNPFFPYCIVFHFASRPKGNYCNLQKMRPNIHEEKDQTIHALHKELLLYFYIPEVRKKKKTELFTFYKNIGFRFIFKESMLSCNWNIADICSLFQDVANNTTKVLIETKEKQIPLKRAENIELAKTLRPGNFLLILDAPWLIGASKESCVIELGERSQYHVIDGVDWSKLKGWKG